MRTALIKILGIIAISPLLLCIVVYCFVRGLGDECLIGDLAIVEIFTRHAMRFALTVGQYSVFGWNHPGPSCFYALAVPYFLSGGKASSLYLGALTLNALSAASVVAMATRVYRRGEPHVAIWSTVFLGAFICLLGVDILASPWNPWIIVVPYAALLFLCAGLCLGWLDLLPLVCLMGSFVVQTHVAALPSVGATIAVCLVFCAGTRRSKHGDIAETCGRGRLWVLLSALVLIVCWLPPLMEQMLHKPGNLTKLATFFASNANAQPIPVVLDAVMGRVSMVSRGIIEAILLPFALPLTPFEEMAIPVVQLCLLLCTWWVSRKRGMPYAAALCLVACVALLSGTWSLFHVQGRIWGYFTQWMAAIGVVNLGVVVGVFFEYLSRRHKSTLSQSRHSSDRLSSALALTVLILMTVWHIKPFVTPGLLPPHDNLVARSLANSLTDYVKGHDNGKILIELPPTSKWFDEIVLVNQLYKAGLPFAVEPARWPLMFDGSFARDGSEKMRLIVAARELPPSPGAVCVASQDSVALYLTDVTNE